MKELKLVNLDDLKRTIYIKMHNEYSTIECTKGIIWDRITDFSRMEQLQGGAVRLILI